MADDHHREAPPHSPPPDPPKMPHADVDPKNFHKHHSPPPPAKYTDRSRRPLLTIIAVILLLAGLTALTLWLIYRPHHPKFKVVGAALYGLNDTSPPFVSAAVQFTLVARNPNRRVSILYDRLSAWVSYRNQALTPPAVLPPLFHETKSTVALSPLLGGPQVPVEAEVRNALAMDQEYGVVGLTLVLTGRVRYKAGAVKTGHRGIHVKCDVLVGLKRGFVGQLPLLQSRPCNVDV